MFSKKQVSVNNLLLTYFESANQEGERVVLFLHGWRSQSSLFFPLAEAVAQQNYRVYCLDLPGFGQSQFPDPSWSLNNYVDTVQKFIEKLGLQKVILIGHSFGGSIGIKLASQHAHLIEKIVLIDSSGIRQQTSGQYAKESVAKLVKPLFALPFMQPMRKKIYQMMGAEDYIATPELQSIFVRVVHDDLTPLFSTINTPTLLVWGENDRDTPVSHANIMNRQIAHSKLIILKDAGHFSFLDKPEECKNAVIQFLSP